MHLQNSMQPAHALTRASTRRIRRKQKEYKKQHNPPSIFPTDQRFLIIFFPLISYSQDKSTTVRLRESAISSRNGLGSWSWPPFGGKQERERQRQRIRHLCFRCPSFTIRQQEEKNTRKPKTTKKGGGGGPNWSYSTKQLIFPS